MNELTAMELRIILCFLFVVMSFIAKALFDLSDSVRRASNALGLISNSLGRAAADIEALKHTYQGNFTNKFVKDTRSYIDQLIAESRVISDDLARKTEAMKAETAKIRSRNKSRKTNKIIRKEA